MFLSIIIPTYNEEKYLPRLLKSIKKQTYRNYEVIVADNNSTDNTRKIATKFGANIVKGGLPGPGRNNGARIARGELLLFLDSDVRLPSDFLFQAIKEFRRKKLAIAISGMKADSEKGVDKLIYIATDILLKTMQHFFACGPGCAGILVKKSIHQKLHGFNSKIILGEDTNYIIRASKLGKFRVLNTYVFVSARRFEAEGRLNLIKKYLKSFYYDVAGHYTKKDIEYKFGIYKNIQMKRKAKKLDL